MVDRPGHWGMLVSKPLEEAAVQEFVANLRGELLRPATLPSLRSTRLG